MAEVWLKAMDLAASSRPDEEQQDQQEARRRQDLRERYPALRRE